MHQIAKFVEYFAKLKCFAFQTFKYMFVNGYFLINAYQKMQKNSSCILLYFHINLVFLHKYEENLKMLN